MHVASPTPILLPHLSPRCRHPLLPPLSSPTSILPPPLSPCCCQLIVFFAIPVVVRGCSDVSMWPSLAPLRPTWSPRRPRLPSRRRYSNVLRAAKNENFRSSRPPSPPWLPTRHGLLRIPLMSLCGLILHLRFMDWFSICELLPIVGCTDPIQREDLLLWWQAWEGKAAAGCSPPRVAEVFLFFFLFLIFWNVW